jgi:hypothetical protein
MDVFGDHEDELQRALGAAGGEQREDVLATWVQYVPAQPIEDILGELERRDGLTWDRAAQASLRLQEAIAELWTQVAEQIETPVVQDVLSSLADAERQMSRRLSKQLLAFQEM